MLNKKPITADDLDALPTHSIITCIEEHGMHYVAIKHGGKWAVSGHRDRMSSDQIVMLTEGKEIIKILEIGHDHSL